MADKDQLELLGREPSGSADAMAIAWLSHGAAGRIGWCEDGADFDRADVSVVVAVGSAEGWRERAGRRAFDVRHLPLSPSGEIADVVLDPQIVALQADLREGRRAVVVGPPREAAFVCGAVLVAEGVEVALVLAMLGSGRRLGDALRARLRERAEHMGSRPASGNPSRSAGESRPAEATADLPKEAPRKELTTDPYLPPSPGLTELAAHPRRGRLLGAVLGAAIGDAMGHPTEFLASIEEIREKYPPLGVTGYALYWTHEERRFAPYTDDTQMAECVLRAVLHAREHELELDAAMRDLSERFVKWSTDPQGGHRSPGNACLHGCRNLAAGVPWSEAGGDRAGGCGSVMRVYPIGLAFSHDLGRVERWSVAQSKLTHRDPIALAACAAMGVGIARVVRDEPLRLVLSEMVGAACRYSPQSAAMMAQALADAFSGAPPERVLAGLLGWAAHEALAAAMYVFARHPNEPRTAVLEAANAPGDSDSIATLVGALVGARMGITAYPPEWVRDLERSRELAELALAL